MTHDNLNASISVQRATHGDTANNCTACGARDFEKPLIFARFGARYGAMTFRLCADCAASLAEKLLPPHGRLIDADATAKTFRKVAREQKNFSAIMIEMAAQCIDAAPTVIEATESAEAGENGTGDTLSKRSRF